MTERTAVTATQTGTHSPWILLEGAAVGTLLGCYLTLRSLFDVLIDDRISGVSVPTIHRFLATDYRAEVVRSALELLALSVVTGALVGLAVALLEWIRRRWFDLTPLRFGPRLLRLTLLWLCVIAFVYLEDAGRRPALHQKELYEQGGGLAWLQVVLSEWLGGDGVTLVAVAAWAAYFGWPLRVVSDAPRRLKQVALAGLLALVLAGSVHLVSGCQRNGAQRTRSDAPNVLLIAADSLRPDRVDLSRAPNLATLRENAASFERAYTPLARTFPAWVSIATGQYPQHHGIRHMFPRWATRARPLDTLAGRLKTAGYRTSVVGDFAADIFRRIDLGYEHVRTPTFTMRELVREHLLKNAPWLMSFVHGSAMRWLFPVVVEMSEATDAQAVTKTAIDEIDRANQQPFFLTVFYSTTHFPYAAPAPYVHRFKQAGYEGPFRFAKADTLNREEMSPADIAQVRGLYDGAVYATDAAIGRLLDALKRRSLDHRTIVIVTADHGEELYEYGRSQGHGDHLQSEAALRVPLLFADPTRPSRRRVSDPVSLVDLAPTVLDRLQLEALPRADGRSLVPVLGGMPPTPKAVYSETGLWFTEIIPEVPLSRRLPYPDLTQLTEVDRAHGDQIVIRERWQTLTTAAKHRMVQLGSLRLLYQPARDKVHVELCNLELDPGCTRDSSREHPAEFEQLQAQFWHLVADDPEVDRKGDRLMPRRLTEVHP
ncbi:MAG: sulfatase [Myxococcales bacterium]